MAATAGVAVPFKVWRIAGSNAAFAPARRLGEKASQTFLFGTPVQIDSGTGFVQACPAITSAATALIAGISVENASNLTTSATAQTLTLAGHPQNQTSAVVIPVGAPPNDGTVGFVQGDLDTHFVGLEGGSTTDADGTIAATDLYAIFGLTKDATTNYWYVDKDITAVSSGACVQVTELIDPVGTLHGRVAFRVLNAAQQSNK